VARIKERLLALLRSGPGVRLLLALAAVLIIAIIFVGLDDTSGYVLGYLATAILFLVMIRHWRSIKSFIFLALATLGIGVVISGLYVEVLSRIALWMWGPGALASAPLRIIESIISIIIIFAGPIGLIFGFLGALILGILRLAGLRKQERIAGNT
jgi:hypothetical protein